MREKLEQKGKRARREDPKQGGNVLSNISSRRKTYALAAALGAIAGGLVVVLATRAIPRMMAGIMQRMMAQMGEGGCNPIEI